MAGRGVPQDQAEAARWYRFAARRGEPIAQHNLGYLYAHGRGVERDLVEAARWFRASAEQGYVQAQAKMGLAYMLGEGVEEDPVQASMWFQLASLAGDKNAAEALAGLTGSMSEEQTAEAKRLVAEWRVQHGGEAGS
jgi:TPR repeat protein